MMDAHSLATCPLAEARRRLAVAGLRPTAHRRLLAWVLLATGPRHVSAETLRRDLQRMGLRVSMATIHKTLRHFAERGVVQALDLDPRRQWFDTSLHPHAHRLDPVTGMPIDG